MNTEKTIKRDNEFILHTYGRSQVVLAKGAGMTATDADGKEYLDFTSGIGVNSLGYCHPAWVKAVADQAATLQHTSNLYYTAPRRQAGEKALPPHRAGRRLLRQLRCRGERGCHQVRPQVQRRYLRREPQQDHHAGELLPWPHAGNADRHRSGCLPPRFRPFPGNFDYVPAGDFDVLKQAADENTCAVMMELVQGEGGVVALDADYVEKVAAFCKERDILVIVDEVQTGVGRTGKFLACEHFDLKPDIVTLAKGLGGGLPIGAVVMNRKVAAHMQPGSHGSTFGGNPVCCAGALAVMETMDDAFMANVNARAAQLRAGLAKLPHVQEVSGLGLMVGIAFDGSIKAADVRAACEKEGLLVLTAKTRLRLLPPLILTAKDVDAALDTLRKVLEKCV